MASPSIEQAKKRKRVPKYFDFLTFADPSYSDNVSFCGEFRDNIRMFLDKCAELIVDCNAEGVTIWRTFLINDSEEFFIPLYTIETDREFSSFPFCDHCKCAGRRYHLIIPVDEEWKKPFTADATDLATHLLHGVIHSNGFGHLLCVKGVEGGSKRLRGREIVDLWDRICGSLRACKITVQDVSKKRGMDLRLLHGIAYGHPWFGRWGYRVLCGGFGEKDDQYDEAIKLLSSLQLDQVTERYKEMKHLIRCYREASATNLITLRDLLAFMLTLKCRPEGSRDAAYLPIMFSTKARNCKSRWSVERLEFTANVIVEALKLNPVEKKSREELNDAARQQVRDTGLVGHVLKLLDNVIVGDYIVRRMTVNNMRKLEYMIVEADKDGAKGAVENTPNGDDIWGDVSFVYTNVLFAYPESDAVKGAARTVLNSNYFEKEWHFRDEQDHTFPSGKSDDQSQWPIVRIAGEDPYTQLKNFAEDVYKKHELEVYFKASIPKGVLDSKVIELNVAIRELWKWFQPKGWVSGEHVAIWSRYLYEQMAEEDRKRVQLVNPSLVHTSAKIAKDDQVESMSQKLADFMVANEAELYIVPYILRSHWVLLVFRPEVKMVYKFDSLHLKRSRDIEMFTNSVANKWYQLNEKVQTCPLRNYKWNLVAMEHKLQTSGWECGYYIMIWMEKITLHVGHSDLEKHFPRDKSAYASEEVLHDLVVRWCEYVAPTFLADWISQANNFINRKIK